MHPGLVLFAARLGFIFVAVAEIETVNHERHIRILRSARIGRPAVPVVGPVPPFEPVTCTFRHQQDALIRRPTWVRGPEGTTGVERPTGLAFPMAY